MHILVLGRSFQGYEGLISRALAELGLDVLFLGYEDIWRSLYGVAPGWFGGVLLRRLLILSALKEYVVRDLPAIEFYNRLAMRLVELFEPELVFVVRGEALSSTTLRALTSLCLLEGWRILIQMILVIGYW